jgi:hypothetical protein
MKDAIEVSIIFHEGQRMFAVPKQPAPVQEPLTDGYVQLVPDKCDRIVWRTRYFHLPIANTPPAAQLAPVQDEHQAFIESLPTDSDDKMYMQIHHWARQSYKHHQSLVRGQMITAADASDTHIIWAALRWAKENTQPAPAVPNAMHHTDMSKTLEYIQGWNACRQATLEMMK